MPIHAEKKISFLLTAFFLTLASHSSDAVTLSTETSSQKVTRANPYHARETHKWIAGYSLNDRYELSSPVYAFGPKPRIGGLGPHGLVEVSPWVRSVKWLKALKEGEEREFVFNPETRSLYVAPSLAKYPGHCCIASLAQASYPYGGNIRRQGGVLRTDELSGHYGSRWHDQIRFHFMEQMMLRGVPVLHEPWSRDANVPDILYIKKVFSHPLTDEEVPQIPSDALVFKNFTNDQLAFYQKNFVRKFGVSIFNLGFPVSIATYRSPSPFLYEQDKDGSSFYRLKDEFRGKGRLDLEFYDPEIGFFDPEPLEEGMFHYYKKLNAAERGL